MQEPYIIPSILKEKGICFIKESDIELDFCDLSLARKNYPKLNKPAFIFDIFQVKTRVQEQIITINLDQLKKLGFYLTSRKVGKNAWMSNQRVMYAIEPKTRRHPASKILHYVPDDHLIQKDINNDRVRLHGINAGKGGASNWLEIEK